MTPKHKHATLAAINDAIGSMNDWPAKSAASTDIFDALYDAKVTCTDDIRQAGQMAGALVESNAHARAVLRLIDGGRA